jgi:hypothetical protein
VWGQSGELLGSVRFVEAFVEGAHDAALGVDEATARADAAVATVACVPFVRAGDYPDPRPPGPLPTRTTTVPLVVGLPEQEARERLEAAGLAMSVAFSSPLREGGVVVYQDRQAGFEVEVGMVIEVQLDTELAPSPSASP